MSTRILGRITFLVFLLGLIAGVLVEKISDKVSFTKKSNQAPQKVEVRDFQQISNDSLVVLAFGQSNSANYGQIRMNKSEGVYNFHNGKLYEAADPMIGADGDKGSVWTRLGKYIIESGRAKNVIFITIGVGDSSIFRWSRYGDLHNKLLYAIKSAQENNLNLDYVFWHQGETDANLFQTSKEDYKRLFKDIILSIRNHNVASPIYVSIATRTKDSLSNETIRNAQIELTNGYDVFQGPDTDQLDEYYRYDGTHFNDEGLEKFSELWMKSIFGS